MGAQAEADEAPPVIKKERTPASEAYDRAQECVDVRRATTWLVVADGLLTWVTIIIIINSNVLSMNFAILGMVVAILPVLGYLGVKFLSWRLLLVYCCYLVVNSGLHLWWMTSMPGGISTTFFGVGGAIVECVVLAAVARLAGIGFRMPLGDINLIARGEHPCQVASEPVHPPI
ncbi:Uncharacterized protein PBTT_05661 [Plasmodiophora brassicae]